MKGIITKFMLLRFLSVIVVQSWFVPDETWQVSEVAHYCCFGYGYLSWEWKEGIRSIFYPGIFSFIFFGLSLMKLDYVFLMIHIPRLISSILFALGDYYFCKVSQKLFGRDSVGWVAVGLSTSWFLAYCAPRTLSSSVEMTLLAVVLYYFPWENEKGSLKTWYLTLGGIGCVMRPTLVVYIFPYCFRHFALNQRKSQLLLRYILNVFGILLINITIDSIFYNELTVVPWNFLKFNFLSGLSAHYGTHPWHWYFSQGIPATCGTHLVPAVVGLKWDFGKYSKIFLPTLWSLFIFSCLGHKEFRFILPIVPVLILIGCDAVHSYFKKSQNGKRRSNRLNWILVCLVIPNVLVFVYMSLIHQRGPIDVMGELRNLISGHPKPSLLFLTPCHSTPLYSHLHVDIPVRFLTCEPNLSGRLDYIDEADLFFKDPNLWIQSQLKEKILDLSSHIIIFDTLDPSLRDFLEANEYKLCSKIFHSHFYDGNRGKYFHIYCAT